MNDATHGADRGSLNGLAFSATVHCLTGCSIGEVLGMVIGTALSWGNWPTVALSVVLAFLFGYAFSLVPLLRASEDPRIVNISSEIVDNAVMLVIPGAMEAGLGSPLFWGSLAVSLILAVIAAFPANRWLIARG